MARKKQINPSEAAAALGRIGGSKPKSYSPEEKARRGAALVAANKAWREREKKSSVAS